MTLRAAVLVLVALAGQAAPAAARTVPKGTPYAAEVQLKVKGTVEVEETFDGEVYRQCPSGASSKQKLHTKVTGTWVATYNQVTIPVANEFELGRAYTRLHVPVTATSKGKGAFLGGFQIDGHGPATEGTGEESDCGSVDFSTAGLLGADPSVPPTFFDQPHKVNGVTEPYPLFVLGAPGTASPEMWADAEGTQRSVETQVLNTLTDVPEAPQTENATVYDNADFGGFAGNFDISNLRYLIKHRKYREGDIARIGQSDCNSDFTQDYKKECRLTWSFKYQPVITRHFLYKTKRPYRY
jgi:hypothetical protein